MIKPIKVPDYKPGIYVLIKDGEPLYIGQSKQVTMRICQHKVSGKKFDDAFLIECDEKNHNAIEGELIRWFKPKQNINCFGRPHAPAKVEGFDATQYISALQKIINGQSPHRTPS